MKPSIKQRWTPFQPALFADPNKPRKVNDELWKNETHTVLVTPCNDRELSEDRYMDGWLVLSIRRNDRAAECDWRIFQRIKNEIAGPEREAVQLFPAMSRCVDSANQYFLFVAPKGFTIGLGYLDQLIVDHGVGPRLGSVQRPFEPGCPIGEKSAVPDDRQYDGVFPIPLYPTDAIKHLRHHPTRVGVAPPQESDDGNQGGG
jgi:hypothetical protein